MVKSNSNFWIKFVIFVLLGVLGQLCESRVLIEGDKMVKSMLENDQTSEIGKMRFKRAARSHKYGRSDWDFGVIPYEIDMKLESIHVAKIKAAMSHWEKYTCITFVERNPAEHENFIILTTEDCGCCSDVGMKRGPQTIGIKCGDGGIVHELGHSIGFEHEHQRPDRDDYIDVIEENSVLDGIRLFINFGKSFEFMVDTLGEPYDFDSIMHYGYTAFTKYGSRDHKIRKTGDAMWDGKWTLANISTILPKVGKNGIVPKIPGIRRLSAGDVRKTNKLYKCPQCGQTYVVQKAVFTSPEYYGTSVNRTYQCQWRIKVMHGDRIQLKINNLDIFKSSDCQSDYLEIRDGYWHKSALLGRFCGTKIPKLILSTGNRMIINYVSNHNRHRGFSAIYEAVCKNTNCRECYQIISDKYDEFSTPGYHNKSEKHLSCWLLA